MKLSYQHYTIFLQYLLQAVTTEGILKCYARRGQRRLGQGAMPPPQIFELKRRVLVRYGYYFSIQLQKIAPRMHQNSPF